MDSRRPHARPLARITDATRTAATGSLSHRIELEARSDEFRELCRQPSTPCSRGSKRTSPSSKRFAANASHELRTPLAITQTLLDVARNDPNRDNGELVERLHAVNARAIDLTEALLLLSRADQRSFAREHVDLSLTAEDATETLLPLAGERGVTIETSGDMTATIGSHALLLQMATNLVHNAIVHNLPEQGTVWVTTSVHRDECGAHGREHRREALPTVGLHAWRAVSSRHRTHTHRPRRCRPRPRNRQEHHPSARRHPHPHPAGRRGPVRHGATTRRATDCRDGRGIAPRRVNAVHQPRCGRRLIRGQSRRRPQADPLRSGSSDASRTRVERAVSAADRATAALWVERAPERCDSAARDRAAGTRCRGVRPSPALLEPEQPLSSAVVRRAVSA